MCVVCSNESEESSKGDSSLHGEDIVMESPSMMTKNWEDIFQMGVRRRVVKRVKGLRNNRVAKDVRVVVVVENKKTQDKTVDGPSSLVPF